MHVTYSDIVTAIADGEWGREFDSKSDAEKEIIGDKQALNAFAMIELIRRFNAIGRACGSQSDGCENRSIQLHGREQAFPNKKVGDRLYSGDLEVGITEYVIIAKDENHRCMVVRLNDFNLKWPPVSFLAHEDHKETLADAVRCAAESDVSYHVWRSEHAKAALEAASSGGDVSRFVGGYKDPED